MPIFQLGLPTCQRAFQFFKHSSYEMLKEISVLYYCIINSISYLISCLYRSCVYVWYIKIVLYFIYILHDAILKKNVWSFCFLKLFCSLVRNDNIKRPGCYTLQVTRVFSNFSQLKQLNKIKNTCEYCGPLELRSELEIRDSYKKPYCGCFFPFLTIMFSSTAVTTLQEQPPKVFCKKRCA